MVNQMAPDLNLFYILQRHGVPFVIVGGHAVFFHGHHRFTEDSDVVWLRSPAAEESLLAALIEVEACSIGKDIDPATGIERLYPISLPFIRANHLMMLWTKFGFLDLFDYIPGHPTTDVHQIAEGCQEANGLRFVSLDWLYKMKQVAGREKDVADVKGLSKIHPK
jgi:hypothetical protein